jgi:hypothetical protein
MSISWTRLGAIAAAGAALVVSVAVAGGAGATGPKTYTASASPAELAPVARQTVSITLTNTTRTTISFAAANITVPTGLVVDTAVRPTLSPARGTAAFSGGSLLKLRDLSVGTTPPGNQVTVTFTLEAVPTSCTTFVWATDVRQSNDFNGTYNQFALTGPQPTMKSSCSAAQVTCTAADGVVCSTGTIVSPSGDAASVVVQDNDTLSGTLTASLTGAVFQCAEYTSTSDQLTFGLTVTNGVPTASMSKTVVFSQPVVDARPAFEYQVCFKAPYDFPALLPSQLAADFANGDFSGNTQPEGSEFKGLLLPCSAGYGLPCVDSRVISGGRISITIRTQVLDPAARF